MSLIFDIESNGFLRQVTKVHCLTARSSAGTLVFNDQPAAVQPSKCAGTINDGIDYLMSSQSICGHNVINYDIPVLKELYPRFKVDEEKVVDTLVMSRLIFTDLGDKDDKVIAKGRLLPQYRGLHKLEAWGLRLGVLKGEYAGDPRIEDAAERREKMWESWNPEMQDYNVQDCVVTDVLLKLLVSKNYSTQALELEHAVAWIIARQQRYGFAFDEQEASKLYATWIGKREALIAEAKNAFAPWFVRDGKNSFIPKRDNVKSGYTAGAPITKIKLREFNPGSRDQIADRLTKLYGWKPVDFTSGGKPEINETTLDGLSFPHVDTLKAYLTLDKRISQLAEGKQAWLKVSEAGVIYGGVNSNGAVTGRMTHMQPNVAQVPKVGNPYGEECRSLFIARKGKVVVGADAAALELRDLAGFMAKYDGGAYIKTVTEGKKEDGTEIHTVNKNALGFTSAMARDIAKTWFYAWAYGAGDLKLGKIAADDLPQGAKPSHEGDFRNLGKTARQKFERNLPALGKLIEKVKKAAKERGYLIGLDGRHLHVRAQHSALNTLLQSAGAIQMKVALVILDQTLQGELNLVPGTDYEFVANIHDEWQIECNPDLGEVIGKAAVQSIQKAGTRLNFRCPLDGEFKVGRNWATTH